MKFFVFIATSLALVACNESQAVDAGVDFGLDAGMDFETDATRVDAGADIGMDATPLDAGAIDDATSCTGDPPPPYRTCLCAEGAGPAITVACSPATGACHTYTTTCVDPGFVDCEASEYAAHLGLEAACAAYAGAAD